MTTEAKCKRTGHCCKRLVASNVDGLRYGVARSPHDADRETMTDKFLTGWELAAEAALKANRKLFTCPFLSNGNVCDLQDNKPSICSSSLSDDVMKSANLSTRKFFHHKCGWLDGAPAKLKRAVYLQTIVNDLPVDEQLPGALQDEFDELVSELEYETDITITKCGKYKTKYLPYKDYGVADGKTCDTEVEEQLPTEG